MRGLQYPQSFSGVRGSEVELSPFFEPGRVREKRLAVLACVWSRYREGIRYTGTEVGTCKDILFHFENRGSFPYYSSKRSTSQECDPYLTLCTFKKIICFFIFQIKAESICLCKSYYFNNIFLRIYSLHSNFTRKTTLLSLVFSAAHSEKCGQKSWLIYRLWKLFGEPPEIVCTVWGLFIFLGRNFTAFINISSRSRIL